MGLWPKWQSSVRTGKLVRLDRETDGDSGGSFIIRTQSEYFLPPPLKFWGLENIQCIPAQSMQNILCFFSSILLSYVKLKATENVFKV